MATGGSSEPIRLLPFKLTDTLYCVEIDRIAAVFPVDGSAPLEKAADPWRAGTVTVDDQTVRVVDLARVFTPSGSIDRPETPELLVFEGIGRTVGWLVDGVGEARPVDRDQIADAPASSRFVQGKVQTASRELLWLDEERIND